MNRPDELERLLGQQLHQQVDGMTDAPIGLGDVKGRAGRIRRNRRIAGGVAVAAVLAVAVPTALLVAPDSQDAGEIPPANRQDGPTTTTLTLDGLDAGAAPTIEYFDEQGVVLPVQGVVPLDESYQALIEHPAWDGWLAVEPGRDEVRDLTADFERTSGHNFNVALVTTPDRSWVSYVWSESGQQTLVSQDLVDDTTVKPWYFPEAPSVYPVGYLDEEGTTILYASTDEQGAVTTGVALPGGGEGNTRELETSFVKAISTDPTTGRAAVMTKANDDGSGCFGVVDGLATGDGTPLWETCDYSLGTFSPDGQYVLASDPYQSGGGKQSLTVLDAGTGEPVASFAQEQPRDRTPVELTQVAWEDGDSAIAVAMNEGDATLLRLGVDGSVEQVVDPAPVVGDVPLYLGMDRTGQW
jgi:hypothetical protein